MRLLINNETPYDLTGYMKTVEDAALAALETSRAKPEGYAEAEADVTFVTLEGIQELNRDYRGVDTVTDVLSFPMGPGPNGAPALLGDIVICFDRACAQAVEYGNTNRREIAFLVVHGMLHLLGYDHADADGEAEMTHIQKETIKRMFAE